MLNKSQPQWSSCSTIAQNTKHSESLRKEKKISSRGNKLLFEISSEKYLSGKAVAYSLECSSANDVKNEKSRLRKLLLSERKKLSPDTWRDKCRDIADNLFSLEIFRRSSKIALYHPINAEVDTKYIFSKSIYEGKKLYFPKVCGRSIHFFCVDQPDGLEPGFKDVFEPKDLNEQISKDKLNLILVPGLGFDISGNRLGYGGGFFDKFLKNLPEYKSIALAFDFQVVNYLPISQHDIKVGRIITESRVIDCMGNKGGLKCKP
ncbi:MAG: 5-formyltetrahydrofolate cyclo-ligase [Thermodesulfobacteriota bacterium]